MNKNELLIETKCKYVYKRGVNKGHTCNKDTTYAFNFIDKNFCFVHTKCKKEIKKDSDSDSDIDDTKLCKAQSKEFGWKCLEQVIEGDSVCKRHLRK